jgi:hypothetical protein
VSYLKYLSDNKRLWVVPLLVLVVLAAYLALRVDDAPTSAFDYRAD